MKKVLLVDDDGHILTLARYLLSEVGVYVETCDSVVLALEKLKKNSHYDLLLSDAKMPRLSGFDLIRTLKKDRRYYKIPIAMLTGINEKENIQHAIELGVEDYIIKPIQPESFVKRVLEILERGSEGKTVLLPKSHRLQRPEKATATLGLDILSIFEKGCTLRSPHFLEEGLILWVGSPFLREIGLNSPQMKVMSSRLIASANEEETWIVHALFHEMKVDAQEKLNDWLQRHPTVDEKKVG